MKHYLYLIIDPLTHRVVYVGRTRNIEKRKKDYLIFNRIHSEKLKYYFASTKKKKTTPIFIVIGEYDDNEIVSKEIDYIKYFAKHGELLNTVHVKEFKYRIKRGRLGSDGKTIIS